MTLVKWIPTSSLFSMETTIKQKRVQMVERVQYGKM